MMKLATRTEGNIIYKAIEYKREVEKNECEYFIGRFDGLVDAIAIELRSSRKQVLRMIDNIERRGM